MTKPTQKKPPRLNESVVALSLAVGSPVQTEMVGQPQQMKRGTNMFMLVPVTEVEFYENNPRRFHDEESYHSIKESIRISGIQQPVHITQRPGQPHYVLAQGGNTRLRIMKELYEETKDEQFRLMPCLYIDFVSETRMRIAHLIENEHRKDMVFWDKACAYKAACDEVQKNYADPLSLRELVDLVEKEGLQTSLGTLSLFTFSVDNLEGLGKHAFQLSRPKATDIRKKYTTLNDLYGKNTDSVVLYDTWCNAVTCWSENQLESAELNVENLLQFIQAEFEARFGIPVTMAPQVNITAAAHELSNETEAASTTQPDDNTGAEALLSDDTHLVQVNDTGAVSTNDGNEPNNATAPCTASSEVDPQKKQYQQVDTAAVEPEITPEQAIKKLHSTIRKWLSMVNLYDCFKVNPKFDYGFYIEYPAFEHLHIPPGSGIYFPVDLLHTEAGNVFMYVSKISNQDVLLNSPDLGANNPLLSLADGSKLKLAYQDQDKYDEFNMMGIGDRANIIIKAIEWQSTKHPFKGILTEILDSLYTVNQILGDGNAK